MTLSIVNFAFIAVLLEVNVFAARCNDATCPDVNMCEYKKGGISHNDGDTAC